METSLAISLASETVGHLGPLEIRNTLLMAWLAMITLITFAFCVRSTGYKLIAGKFQTMVEMVIGGLYDLFAGIVQDEALAKKFFPLVCTMTVFIVIGNWMGILPGVGSITILGMHEGEMEQIPLLRSMNADVNMTLAVALIAMFSVQIFGIWRLGFVPYMSKFIVAPWKSPMGSFVGILEVISEFSKVVSFTFRLFGNIFAGEVLLIVISYISPYLAPVPFLGMEVFVGVIQGFVFALLTTAFIKMATTGHEDHSEHDAPATPVAA